MRAAGGVRGCGEGVRGSDEHLLQASVRVRLQMRRLLQQRGPAVHEHQRQLPQQGGRPGSARALHPSAVLPAAFRGPQSRPQLLVWSLGNEVNVPVVGAFRGRPSPKE